MEENHTEPDVQAFICKLGYTGKGGNRVQHREIVHRAAVWHSKEKYGVEWFKNSCCRNTTVLGSGCGGLDVRGTPWRTLGTQQRVQTGQSIQDSGHTAEGRQGNHGGLWTPHRGLAGQFTEDFGHTAERVGRAFSGGLWAHTSLGSL